MTIPFETSSKPWFGPHKRAAEMLAHRTSVMPPQQAIEAIEGILGRAAGRVGRVRFIDYLHRSAKPFRFTIALLWIGPDAAARDAVYDLADDIVRITGWYTLPQGDRLSSRVFERAFRELRIPQAPAEVPIELGGNVLSIRSAVGQDGGCSIRIVTDQGSLLLDSGLPGALSPEPSDRLVLLSHGHLDHCGGIVFGACASLPAVMSTATAMMLRATDRVSAAQLRRQALLLDAGQVARFGGLTVSSFTVPHCPGSTGYVVAGADRTLVFTGDVALRSARHDFVPKLSNILSGYTSGCCTALVDGTMVGRTHGVTNTESAAVLLGKLTEYEDIVLVSDDVEQLLYAFLDVFHSVKSGADTRARNEFIVTPRLRSVFQILHSAFITHQLDLMDPFLVAQYGSSMSAWAESRWLYWMGAEMCLQPGSRYGRIWFVTKHEMGKVVPRGRIGLVPIGRLEGDASVTVPGGELLDIDSAVWTLHSDERTLLDVVRRVSASSSVVLFHNFRKRINKFVTANGLSCMALDDAADPPAVVRT